LKKIIASLGVIALVAVLGVAVVFAYGSYKDLELKKEEAKLAENKIKEDDKKEKSKKSIIMVKKKVIIQQIIKHP